MIQIKPTSTTGRTVEIDTAHLRARIVDGAVERWEVREPPGGAELVALVAERAAVCRECDGGGPDAVRLTVKGRTLNRVRCKPAGCGNLSLVSGRCVKGKWEAE